VTFFNKLLLRWRCRRFHLLWNGSEGSKEQLQTQLSLVSLSRWISQHFCSATQYP